MLLGPFDIRLSDFFQLSEDFDTKWTSLMKAREHRERDKPRNNRKILPFEINAAAFYDAAEDFEVQWSTILAAKKARTPLTKGLTYSFLWTNDRKRCTFREFAFARYREVTKKDATATNLELSQRALSRLCPNALNFASFCLLGQHLTMFILNEMEDVVWTAFIEAFLTLSSNLSLPPNFVSTVLRKVFYRKLYKEVAEEFTREGEKFIKGG
jgi:hypothetical protein